MSYIYVIVSFFFLRYGHHRDLHVLTYSFPTRRSSDLLEAAQAALSQTVERDPNQFGAYVMQAQLALGRGDVDDAERLARLAARVEPKHPWTRLLEGSVAVERGDRKRTRLNSSH